MFYGQRKQHDAKELVKESQLSTVARFGDSFDKADLLISTENFPIQIKEPRDLQRDLFDTHSKIVLELRFIAWSRRYEESLSSREQIGNHLDTSSGLPSKDLRT